ncbi:MAG: ABC transporter ATP-binding protein [Candidatus Rokubacteria bacterium]|nr:ABC transporter ATP-binding protein [Candidatus Rokubacteria bacterium]
MSLLELRGLGKRYGAVTALDGVSLAVAAGDFVTLLGPSGCGKTTLLKIIAGFVEASAGDVLLEGRRLNDVPAHRRGIGIVFQNYALFPHMTVAQNVAFGPRMWRVPCPDVRRRVEEALALVKLEGFAERLPAELSGGQQQRVALARVLAVKPRVVLLDEPFGALDKNLRLDMQMELKKLLRALSITALFVTHDQEEALTMSDRIAVMERGRFVQVGSPIEIYDAPASSFVATFIGTSNLLPAAVAPDGRGVLLGGGLLLRVAPGASQAAEHVRVVIRPENLSVQRERAADAWPGVVTVALPLGASTVYEVELAQGLAVRASEPRVLDHGLLAPGEKVFVRVVNPDACRVFAPNP